MQYRFLHIVLAMMVWGCGTSDPANNDSNNITPDLSFPDVAFDDGVEEVEGQEFRIGTFNTRRFFDTTCQSNNCGAGAFEELKSEAEFDYRADQIAKAIEKMDVDAIVLQEVENQVALNKLISKLQDPYSVAIIGEIGSAASLDVAILSRGTWLETRLHRQDPIVRPDNSTTSFTREFLEVHVEVEGQRVVLFAAHFRSQRDDDEGRRIAEANAAQRIVKATAQEYPDALVVWGGDLNDTPESEALSSIVSDPNLELLSEPGFWTYRFFDDLNHIDHLIMARNNAGRLVEGSLEKFSDGDGFGGSDHAAAAATFLLTDNE